MEPLERYRAKRSFDQTPNRAATASRRPQTSSISSSKNTTLAACIMTSGSKPTESLSHGRFPKGRRMIRTSNGSLFTWKITRSTISISKGSSPMLNTVRAL